MEKNKINQNVRLVRSIASDLRVREKDDGSQSRTITGYAILFDTRSAPMWSWDDEEAYEVIAKEAVTQELLDQSDIKMTMFHNRELILARSNRGKGTLSYSIDDKGVAFEFEAPQTADGDKALELVRRGDLAGCSFAFSTHYYDRQFVSLDIEKDGDKSIEIYTVRAMTGIYDFTIAADPAYPDTEVSAEQRELVKGLHDADKEKQEREEQKKKEEKDKLIREQASDMRRAASHRHISIY